MVSECCVWCSATLESTKRLRYAHTRSLGRWNQADKVGSVQRTGFEFTVNEAIFSYDSSNSHTSYARHALQSRTNFWSFERSLERAARHYADFENVRKEHLSWNQFSNSVALLAHKSWVRGVHWAAYGENESDYFGNLSSWARLDSAERRERAAKKK